MNAANLCSSNARKMLEIHLSPPDISVCENFYEIVETKDFDILPDTDDYHEIDVMFFGR